MKKIRVLVVDDSEFLRRTLPRLLESDPEIEVVATARSGIEALEKVRELRPDVITLDVMMPDMDGLTALRLIMRDMPTPVVMVSMTTYDGAWETLEALALGAVDFVTKPSGPISLDIAGRRAELVEKVRLAYAARHKIVDRAQHPLKRFRDLQEGLARGVTEPLPPQAPAEESRAKPATAPLPSVKPTTRPLPPAKPTTRPLPPVKPATAPLLPAKPTTRPLPPAKPATGPLPSVKPITGPLTLKQKTGSLAPEKPSPEPSRLRERPISGPDREPPPGGRQLVAIAASTGGPAALQELLPRLPADLGAGVVIVQHIAPGFTRPLAELLNSLSSLAVMEAVDGAPITPGVALLAPAGLHLRVLRRGEAYVAQLDPEPSRAHHRPSADVLFRSIAQCCAPDVCAVLLTGMGEDGALGLRAIYEAGGWTVAQDEASSVVWGMPRRAVELGAVRALLSLEDIAGEIVRATRK